MGEVYVAEIEGGTTRSINLMLDKVVVDYLSKIGVSHSWLVFSRLVVYLLLALIVVLVLHYLVRVAIRLLIKKEHNNKRKSFLDYAIDNRLPYFLALIVPYIFIRNFIPTMFSDFQGLIRPAIKLADTFLVLFTVWSVLAIVKSFVNVLQERPAFKHKPMRSYVQVISIILHVLGGITIFAIFTEQSPAVILGTFGAASAVTMLVFQDSIKGFVGSVQMTANNMVELDDWITMDKYKADGNVEEINLTTVKVRNFDNSVTTIPTYSLVSDSFQNWKPMQTSGGRRLKRSLLMKQGSIRFMKEEELTKFDEMECLTKVISDRKERYKDLSKKIIGDATPVTNNDLFMAYAQHYIENHPEMNKSMTMMFRQTAPTSEGLPLEVFVFIAKTGIVDYERISSEVINHLIGMTPFFGLMLFELQSDTVGIHN